MQSKHFSRAAILALLLVIGFIVSWERYWTGRGHTISYNDDKVAWAGKRKEASGPGRSTIFIGTSRIKFDLDIDSWQRLTGERAIQLGLVGSPCRGVLLDLANDQQFAGKLIIEVLEPTFFSTANREREKYVWDAIDYFHNETPAQKAGAVINQFLESRFVFLDEVKFGLASLLSDAGIRNRQGIVTRTLPKRDFATVTADRQHKFTPLFLDNPAKIKNWLDIRKREGAIRRIPPLTGAGLDSFLLSVKMAIDKIKGRGGKVLFIRPPSTGLALERETKNEPRQKYWERLLTYTNCAGYHFADYTETATLQCPDQSHLSPTDAVKYTTHLVNQLKKRDWFY